MRNLAGKVAVVSGASRGMGRHMAQALVEAGARVALLARPSEALTTAVQELGPRQAFAAPCDIGDPDQVRSAFDDAVAAFGRIDILVNNAGIFLPSRIEQASDAHIASQINVNLMGAIYCVRAAIPHLRAAGGGDIVNVSSESVAAPFPYLAVYAATKGGLEVFSAALRNELRDDRIRVAVLRSGRVSGSTGASGWAPDIAAEFFAAITDAGHVTAHGSREASPQTMASALCDLLSLPRDASVELATVRAF